jgi:hypothetical protein
VLLFDAEPTSGSYTESLFAKIFAEVTTQAKALHKIHSEWLSRAFQIAPYDDELHRNAIDTVLDLVSNTSTMNSAFFFDKIQLNPYRTHAPRRVFDYDLISLKVIIYKNYFQRPTDPSAARLTSTELAEEIISAVYHLSQAVRNHANSVFFGDDRSRMKIVQTGFITGVAGYLLRYASPSRSVSTRYSKPEDWDSLFSSMGFNQENWDFKSWTRSLSGRMNTLSSKIITECFLNIMRGRVSRGSGVLSSGFVSFLKGEGEPIRLATKPSQASHRSNIAKTEYPCRGARAYGMNGHDMFRIDACLPNVVISEIVDKNSTAANPFRYSPHKFHALPVVGQPVILAVKTHLFGGNSDELELTLRP